MKNNKGFTLIEILITIVILGLIATTAIIITNNVIESGKTKAQKIFESNLRTSAVTYTNEFSQYTPWRKQYINNSITENEFVCVPILYLIEKGYLKPNIKDPKDNTSVKNKRIKVERNANTKVVVLESISLDELDCYFDEIGPNVNISLKDQDNLDYTNGTWTNKNIIINITATDESGINSIRVKRGGKEEIYYTNNKEIIINNSINEEITIYAMDNLGNSSTKNTYNIKIDKEPTPPTITGGSELWYKSINISVSTPSQSLSGILRYDYCAMTTNSSTGCSWQPLTNGVVLKTFNTNQDNYIFFRGVNALNDVSSPSNSQRIRIDTVIPIVNLSGIPSSFYKNTLYQLPTSVTYGNSSGSVVCKYNDVVITNTSSIPLGTYTITCTATSGSGVAGSGSKSVYVSSPCQCTRDSQCGTNYSCDGCSCYYDPECYSDSNCGSNEYCSGGTCYTKPTPACADYHESCTSTSCCGSWRCSASRGICVTPSSDGGDTGETTPNGCSCRTNSDCKSGSYCDGYYCCIGNNCCA